MGKLSYLRILSGRIAPDTTLVNLRSGKTAKAGHIYVLQGKQQEEVPRGDRRRHRGRSPSSTTCTSPTP